MLMKIWECWHKSSYKSAYISYCQKSCIKQVVCKVVQFNGVIQIYQRLTTVTKIWQFWHKLAIIQLI